MGGHIDIPHELTGLTSMASVSAGLVWFYAKLEVFGAHGAMNLSSLVSTKRAGICGLEPTRTSQESGATTSIPFLPFYTHGWGSRRGRQDKCLC